MLEFMEFSPNPIRYRLSIVSAERLEYPLKQKGVIKPNVVLGRDVLPFPSGKFIFGAAILLDTVVKKSPDEYQGFGSLVTPLDIDGAFKEGEGAATPSIVFYDETTRENRDGISDKATMAMEAVNKLLDEVYSPLSLPADARPIDIIDEDLTTEE